MTFIVGETDECRECCARDKVSLDKGIEASSRAFPSMSSSRHRDARAQVQSRRRSLSSSAMSVGPEFHGSMQIPPLLRCTCPHHHAARHDLHHANDVDARHTGSAASGRRLTAVTLDGRRSAHSSTPFSSPRPAAKCSRSRVTVGRPPMCSPRLSVSDSNSTPRSHKDVSAAFVSEGIAPEFVEQREPDDRQQRAARRAELSTKEVVADFRM